MTMVLQFFVVDNFSTIIVQAYQQHISVNYGQKFSIIYCLLLHSSLMGQIISTYLLTVEHITTEDSCDPALTVSLDHLSIVSDNIYKLAVPFAISGVYNLYAQRRLHIVVVLTYLWSKNICLLCVVPQQNFS